MKLESEGVIELFASRADLFGRVKGYEEWSKAALEILDEGMPSTLDIRTAREAYHWSNVARRFVRVYDDLVSSYYGAK